LHGRAAVVTGASRGLGFAIARAFVDEDASVLLCARDETQLAHARSELRAVAGPGQRVETMRADVTNVADVQRLVDAALEAFSRVHILVCNAGVYGPLGAIEDVDWEEWTRALRINVEGSVLPCRALVPHFKQHGYGKIIQLSGGGATTPLPRISAYAASKAAIVRFAESLALELRDFHIDVNSLAPGALNTRMLDEILSAGPERVGREYFDRMTKVKVEGGTPLEKGAALAVYLASEASDGITGRLLSAAWDAWPTLGERWPDIEPTDIYTLRRILPKDRGRPDE
jgi:NAD(P)-dependent dehydrogenase (short-subunit alcohol dehydrogenase family)